MRRTGLDDVTLDGNRAARSAAEAEHGGVEVEARAVGVCGQIGRVRGGGELVGGVGEDRRGHLAEPGEEHAGSGFVAQGDPRDVLAVGHVLRLGVRLEEVLHGPRVAAEERAGLAVGVVLLGAAAVVFGL